MLAGEELGDRIAGLAPSIHAATAELVEMAAELDASGGWGSTHSGIRGCAHWLSINCGFDTWYGAEIVRCGHALKSLPETATAFREGRLSFDKVRHLTRVASPADETIWLEIAMQASGSQLARICQAYQRCTVKEGEDVSLKQQAERRVRMWWREDGMLDLYATLPPEEGSLVQSAIESAAGMLPLPGTEGADTFPALDAWAARRADALVRVCGRWLGGEPGEDKVAPARMVVHVDLEVLAGVADGGRCHIEGGPAITRDLVRKIGCDCEIVAVTEKDGLPIDVGKTRRVASVRQRRAIQLRDKTCRFPGCGVPAIDCVPHHVIHWADGGPTEMWNQLSLCRYHHGRLHDGAFEIRMERGHAPTFVTADGLVIGGPREPSGHEPAGAAAIKGWVARSSLPIADTARAGDGGRPFDLGYAVDVIAGSSAQARREAATRAGPGG